MSEKLSLLLRKIIREEIRTELQMFKKEIINELRSSSPGKQITEVQTKTGALSPEMKQQLRNKIAPKPDFKSKPTRQFNTGNSLLNEILSETPESIEDDSFDPFFDESGMNWTGPEGQAVNPQNESVQAVTGMLDRLFNK